VGIHELGQATAASDGAQGRPRLVTLRDTAEFVTGFKAVRKDAALEHAIDGIF
jgi:hypothetical protein